MIETTYRSAELVYRAGEDGAPDVLEGRMVPYNEWTEIHSSIEGHFLERVAPGALTKTLAEKAGKLKILFEHGFSRTLDRAAIGMVQDFEEREDGAHYRGELLGSIPAWIRDGIARGYYGTSIAMKRAGIKVDVERSPKKSDYNPTGLPEHTVRETGLREISVVTFPAYEGATAGLARSVTDDVFGEILIPFLTRERPDFLLALAKSTEEPNHSEPDAQEDPDVKASRSTPKATKDYLADKEARPEWLI